ncbi:hypothetical protein [Streptomyces sp. NPDC060035]
MGDTPHETSTRHQGRNPQRRKIGVLGWALLTLFLVAMFTLGPR